MKRVTVFDLFVCLFFFSGNHTHISLFKICPFFQSLSFSSFFLLLNTQPLIELSVGLSSHNHR